MPLARASRWILSAGRNRNFRPPAHGEAVVGRAEAVAHSTRRVHISLRDPSPPRPRTSFREHAPPLNLPVLGQVGWQVHAGGGHAGADSTVKMITNEAELPYPQGHDHPLGCRHLHLLEDARQRDRGHHLGGSSSVWRCSRRGLACSSSSPSGDESFCNCLEHTWNVMMLCSPVRLAGLATLQPVLFGRACFGACVCCPGSTRVVQTCAVTCHRSSTTYPSRPPSLEERVGRVRVWSDQGHS